MPLKLELFTRVSNCLKLQGHFKQHLKWIVNGYLTQVFFKQFIYEMPKEHLLSHLPSSCIHFKINLNASHRQTRFPSATPDVNALFLTASFEVLY